MMESMVFKETLYDIDLPVVPKLRSGKVREVFDLGEDLLFVATDRVSAFDCVLPTPIPDKGRVLNLISAFWFKKLNNIVLNHFKTADYDQFPQILQEYRPWLEGRSMLVKKLRPIPVECVVRGYLAGSGWKEYQATGKVCGVELPPGLKECDQLPEPIFTPAMKNDKGHDENITFEQMASTIGGGNAAKLRTASLSLYEAASKHMSQAGILIADTKFEFGFQHGETVLMDECLTPDSSRFWFRAQYSPGKTQNGLDKQYIRDYLHSLDWDKNPPAPGLPEDVVHNTTELYRQAYRRITGASLPD
ncbi:phosphoribosylaminoimidazolesuccinocarboxamide synthase [Oscillatoria amoena NRMC-F 0135]|nr:phosphoribosylaminoimidazolesuccinocarboxamide synthase [Oscillatoria laete-virens]MDL5047223.1 phosphoribosylaminoimidazolesuccinocarboxamide synthase [Oscillatoria amoena NRMC-F 0135]MDL5052547.1 phosphoribosylaminoimidazolesuccinocarboxamide synthase [Oscillatoria laete-virens NRMC-F 0139]